MQATRRVPQYEGVSQRLGGDKAVARSQDEMAAQRVEKLGKTGVRDPKIARHIEAEEQRKAEAARKQAEEEKKLARARELAEKNKARKALVANASPELLAARAEGRMTPPELRAFVSRVDGEALLLLRKVVSNLVAQPDSRKFRQLRRHNPKLHPLFTHPHALAILYFAGFADAEIDDDDNGVLESFITLPMGASLEHLHKVHAALGGVGGALGGVGGAAAGASAMAGGSSHSGPPSPTPSPTPAPSGALIARDVPDEIVCPIRNEVMTHPVITAAGNTYERAAIVEWFARCRADSRPLTDPKSHVRLPSDILIENHSVRSLAAAFRDEQQAARQAKLEAAAAAAAPVPVPVPVVDIADRAPPPPAAPALDVAPPIAPPREPIVDPVEELYVAQLQQLADMGFEDLDANLTVLGAANGNVDRALEMLLT